jgi:hypothetical protein
VAPEEARGKYFLSKKCYRYPYKQCDFKQRDRKDRLFYRFMREQFGDKDPYDYYTKWTYGIPHGDSAYISVRKYESPLVCPEPEILSICKDWCKRHFACMGNSRVNWDFDYIKSMMNLSSSPGFPYNRSCFYGKGYGNKRDIFAQPEFVISEMEKLKEAFLRGNVSEIYVCSPKEELRATEKVKQNKFRTFTSASFRNTALGVALFGDMTSKFYSQAESPGFWSKVGSSLFARGWDKLYRSLNNHPNAFEGDFSSFDAIIHPAWIEALGEVFLSFYDLNNQTDEIKALCRAYFQNIIYGQIICPNGELYSKFQGNPSGSSLTIVTNTMIHYMLFVYAWMKLGGPADYLYFHSNVSCALCGDDSLWTVSDECVDFFNIKAVAAVWNEIGLIMKPEATKCGKLRDLKFLSHAFQEEYGMMFPIPDADKVVSSLLYKSLPVGDDHENEAIAARLSLLKANALRITSWCCKPVRELISRYIRWLHDNYLIALTSPCTGKGQDQFSYDDVQSVYKTDQELMYMYTILETGSLGNTGFSCLNSFTQRQKDLFESVVGDAS